MRAFYYIGLDINKKMIAYCIKALDGHLIEQGIIETDFIPREEKEAA